MDFTNVTNGVITEYSAPSAELVNELAKSISSNELDSIREMIVENYKANNGKVDLKKLPLKYLC